jgi:predicted tellurium resistance membrane protein TerC
MTSLVNNIFSVLQITLIDIVLSGDNMGVIALAVRKLPKDQARYANIVGVAGAVLLRIFFASIITTLLLVEWTPIKLVGLIIISYGIYVTRTGINWKRKK